MSERATPETTAAIMDARGAWSFELRQKMEQLERERDKARSDLTEERHAWEKEREEWRVDCVGMVFENKAMREAIKEAHEMIAEHVSATDWPALNAQKLTAALAKLAPFLSA